MIIVTASNRPEVLKENLGKSEIIKKCPLIWGLGNMNDFNIPDIYNKADIGEEEMVMYVHDDVMIPGKAIDKIIKSVQFLTDQRIKWGVLGVAGAVTNMEGQRELKGWISDRGRSWGKALLNPSRTQTLDELLLIVNKEAGLTFDEQFPLDFYGADICMQSHEKGYAVAVIPLYVFHNSSRKIGERTPSFYESERKFREKWAHRLPICTTCSILK